MTYSWLTCDYIPPHLNSAVIGSLFLCLREMLAPVQHSTPSSCPFLLPPICVCALLLGDGYKREESRGCLACPVFVVYNYFLSPPPKNVWVAMEWSQQQQPPVSCLPYPSKVKDAGGDHKNIFPATCFSDLLFVFAQEAHKTTTKESGNGFPLSFNTPLYSLSADWCPSCLLCALK